MKNVLRQRVWKKSMSGPKDEPPGKKVNLQVWLNIPVFS